MIEVSEIRYEWLKKNWKIEVRGTMLKCTETTLFHPGYSAKSTLQTTLIPFSDPPIKRGTLQSSDIDTRSQQHQTSLHSLILNWLVLFMDWSTSVCVPLKPETFQSTHKQRWTDLETWIASLVAMVFNMKKKKKNVYKNISLRKLASQWPLVGLCVMS